MLVFMILVIIIESFYLWESIFQPFSYAFATESFSYVLQSPQSSLTVVNMYI